jgi:photosystem II stability/assembly factor-like uncharacterized protein
VERTLDGGATFDYQMLGTGQHLEDIAADGSRLWTVGSNGIAWTSTNSGTSWSSTDTGAGTRLRAVAVGSNGHVIAVGSGGTIVRSTNGGSSWLTPASGTTNDLHEVSVRGNLVLAVGTSGRVVRSTDGGETFTVATSPTGSTLVDSAIGTDGRFWVVRQNGVWRSSDQGNTWEAVAVGGTGNWLSITTTGHFVAIGATDRTSVSVDGGVNWSYDVATGSIWLDVSFVDVHTYWGVGNEGEVTRSRPPISIPDYAPAGPRWSGGLTSSMFGACLQELRSGAAPVDWTAKGSPCTAADDGWWRAVPAAPATIASAPSGVTGEAVLVWGVRVAPNQQPGSYAAHVRVEVIAP